MALLNLSSLDDHTRECLALVADTSLSGRRVVRELDAVIARRGRPLTVVSDTGTEFTSMAILCASYEMRALISLVAVDAHSISAGPVETNSQSGKASGSHRTRCRRNDRGQMAVGPPYEPMLSPWQLMILRTTRYEIPMFTLQGLASVAPQRSSAATGKC